MRSDLLAAAVLVPTALVALRVILWREWVRDRAAFRLSFPRDLDAAGILAWLRSVHGLLPPWWKRAFSWPHVVVEVEASHEMVTHRLIVPVRCEEFVLAQLRTHVPGVRVEPDDAPRRTIRFGGSVRASGVGELRVDEPAMVASSILGALAPLAVGERLIVQWVLAPSVGGSPRRSLLDLLRGTDSLSADQLNAARRKASDSMFAVSGRLGAEASSRRARLLVGRLTSSLHAANSPDAKMRRRLVDAPQARRLIERATPPLFSHPLVLNARELAGLLAWPIASPRIPGLALGGCPHLPASPRIPSTGRVVGESTFPGSRRPLAISVTDSLMHMLVTGPTGVGKSTLLLNLAAGDVASGYGLMLMDLKGDLALDLLDRIPKERIDDVVVFDPTDAERPVGLPLFDASRDAELVASSFVSIMRQLWASSWGPRTQDVLTAAALTLARIPGMTPAEIPLLLTDEAFRRRIVASLSDHVLLQFFAWYEALSPAERAAMIGPVLNKLRQFLMMSRMRNVVAQETPRFTFDEIVEGGKILVVRLPRGVIGEEASALLASLILTELWRAVQRRAVVPEAMRRPFFAVIDEAQHALHLPVAIGEMLAEARGLGLGLTLAFQSITAQLPAQVRSQVLANARSKVSFQVSAQDAALLAKEYAPWLTAENLTGLGVREIVLKASCDSEMTPPATARTQPPTPSLGSRETVLARSRQRYGRDRAEVEASIEQRHNPSRPPRTVGGRRVS